MGMLRLGRGIRIQFEKVSQSHVLLFPEGIVDLNESAFTILSNLPMKRDDLHTHLCKLTNTRPPLEGFDEFVADALKSKWIINDATNSKMDDRGNDI